MSSYPDEAPPKRLILLVDDDEAHNWALGQLLEKLGYHTLAVSSSEEALLLCKARLPESAFVLTDFNMPAMNGVALAQALRSLDPAAFPWGESYLLLEEEPGE
jgi:CheY-like chemotaxis protein